VTGSSFADLRTRGLSALGMAVIGLGAIWIGGYVFAALAILLAGLMGWELYRMLDPDAAEGRAEANGVSAAVLVGVFSFTLGGWLSVAGLALGALLLASRMPRDRWVFGTYLFMAMLAAHGLIQIRLVLPVWMVPWLVAVVIASDVAGYFAGRALGGPKFWPRISPKKTWSGTVAGWLLAALVGWATASFLAGEERAMPWALVPVSALLALAGQMGDIAESAIKRHAGVKDSSNLIPGHGGVLDRFDALIAVAALSWLLILAGVVGGTGA
jgi:phosphatidate cytidylyltransferase